MSRKIINTGAGANDGSGDNLRSAGEKINDNFAELYSLVTADSGISIEEITAYIDASVATATDDLDITAIIANAQSIVQLQSRTNLQDSQIIGLDSDISKLETDLLNLLNGVEKSYHILSS